MGNLLVRHAVFARGGQARFPLYDIMTSLFKKPSAWIPIALSIVMSAFIFTMIFIQVNQFGAIVREADEGVGARLFQIWLVLEVFMVGFFAVKWLPIEPKQTIFILALQIIAILIACAPVFILKL